MNKQAERKISLKIGANIRKAREEMGVSLNEMARDLRQPKCKIHNIETGKISCSAPLLAEIAGYLDVSVVYLYSGKEMSVSEELFFDASRTIAPLKLEMDKHFAETLTKFAALMFPVQDKSTSLAQEVMNITAQFSRLVQLNEQGAWQDMKGGQKFEAQMQKLSRLADETTKAATLKNRAKKELNEQAQLGLFEHVSI